MNYVAIMAGGVGSRFWPASRSSRPKQFLDILGTGKSLIRHTYERFLNLVPSENIYVVTNEQYRGLVSEHLPELQPHQIIGEPSRNNTAPSVAYAAYKIHALDPGANMVIAPSDHIILKEVVFLKIMEKALQFTATHDALCTLGITPTRPDTGYGYIHFDREGQNRVHKVLEFKEKPDEATARSYLASGAYLWNAGIFIWRTGSILEAYRKYAPGIAQLLENDAKVYNTEAEKQFISENYPQTPNISVDFAILEKAGNVYTIPADIGWSDLGTWASLHEELPKSNDGNVLQGDKIVAIDTHNTLLRSNSGRLVVVSGLENYIVVDEKDVLLIWPKSREQEIKAARSTAIERHGKGFS